MKSLKKLTAQFMKFGVVGVIAFLIDYLTMIALTELFGVPYLISTTISFIVSVIFNYLASMRYVFAHKEGMSRRTEFIIFVVLSAIGLVINDACMWYGVERLGIDYRITKIGATVIVAIWNFFSRKATLEGEGPTDAEKARQAKKSSTNVQSAQNSHGARGSEK